MEDNRFFGVKQKLNELITKQMREKILLIAIGFFAGFLTTRAMTFGKYSPFSVAVVASVPKGALWPAIIGGIFGYMLPSPIYIPFRYIVSILAVAAIRWALSELTKINSGQFFAPVVAFLPLLATGVTIALISNSIGSVIAMYVAESFLAAGVSFFFTRSIKLITEKKLRTVFDNIDVASLSVSVGVLILSFNEVAIYGISIGRILMVLMILTCSGAGGIAGGAISGVAAGTIAGLSGLGLSYLSGAYGLGGLMAGVFSPAGKIFSAIAFTVASGMASLQIGSSSDVINSTIEVALATLAYMLIPQNRRLNELFTNRRDKLSGESLRNNIVMRLNHASKALGGISNSVDEISEKLAKSNAASMSKVYNNAAGEICAGCSLRALCWKKNKKESIEAFTALTPYLKMKGKIESTDFSEYFTDRCGRAGEMRESINKFYRAYLNKQAAEIRAANVRDIAGEQFKITSAMLTDMASEVSLYQSFDEEAVERVNEVFRRLEIFPIEICCRTDKHGRMTVEAEIEKVKSTKLNKAQLTREISKACTRIFSQPCISATEHSYKIQMCQKPLLDVSVAMDQSSAASLCGDSAVTFYDGQGKYIAIISDGMGTGGMAAVDGAMASSIMESMLKAGIGYDTALRMVNSALMSKSEEETLATMDVVSLDLFTGRCEFRKAGGALSIIKKSGKIHVVEEDSLPVGIMQDVKFTLSLEALKKDDIIVMMSDGVSSSGSDWIKETVGNYQGDSPEELSKEIVSYAKRNRLDGHTDDITALVIMVTSSL